MNIVSELIFSSQRLFLIIAYSKTDCFKLLLLGHSKSNGSIFFATKTCKNNRGSIAKTVSVLEYPTCT